MKALPMWQPWASLVAVGAKRVETRGWACPPALIGQRIAIHATKTKRELRVVATDPFRSRLREAHQAGLLAMDGGQLPLGALLCTVVVDRCTEMTSGNIAALRARDEDEYAFGLYEPGRFAWVLRDVQRLTRPVPYKGRQGMFDVPERLLLYPTAQYQPPLVLPVYLGIDWTEVHRFERAKPRWEP